jgi:Spy/CpxP family protein refolding chaperone
MSVITTSDLIKAVARELRYRRRVYPRLIDQGKLDERTADHEIACMEELQRRLEFQKDKESNQMNLL